MVAFCLETLKFGLQIESIDFKPLCMSKLKCKCGEILSDSKAPSDIVHHLLSDIELDEIFQKDTIGVLALSKLLHPTLVQGVSRSKRA